MSEYNSLAQELFVEFWSWRLQRSPEFASLVGDKNLNGVLESYTEQRFEEDYNTCLSFLKRAEDLLMRKDIASETLTKDNLEFFVGEVKTFTDGYKFKGFYFPINYMEGLHIDFQRLPEWFEPQTLEDLRDWIARMKSLPGYVEDIKLVMRSAIKQNMTNHEVSMKGVVDKFRSHTVGEVSASVFFSPFLNCKNFTGTEEEKGQIKAEAETVIVQNVRTAFEDLASFLETEYIPACRKGIAATSLPGGPDFYAACLKFHTSTDLSPSQIHQRGLEEVQRIEDEMRAIIKEMGYDLTLKQFIDKLREDQSNCFSTGQELLDSFKDIIENKINPKLTTLFLKAPKGKLDIVASPNAACPAAFYIAGTADGSRSSKLFANTAMATSQPTYEMVSLSLHEANPGHHLQGCYIQQDTWPDFRKVMEDRIYSQVPSRFPINTAYCEGWALYCETLGHDLKLYDNPIDRYGHLSEEIFRACRLVVDPGMHALGWSREQAVAYMLEHTAASRGNIEGEVDRYITWPGQATGYKVGQMKILELRRRAEEALGVKFDIKEFHEVLLRAAGPLDILEKKVDDFIATNL